MHLTVLGSGYVGLVTGACLAAAGHTVMCVDVVPERVAQINDARPPFHEPGLADLLRHGRASGRLAATADLAAAVAQSDLSLIAVGTPPGPHGADLSQLTAAVEQLGAALGAQGRYHVVVIKSTVPPGTTDGLVRPILERFCAPERFGLAMNPEFLREGSAVDDFLHPDRIVIGTRDQRAAEAVAGLYAGMDCPIIQTTPPNAELTKYAANSLLALLVSFGNELAGICERLPDTDVDAVIDGVELDGRLSPRVDGRRVRPGILSYLRAGIGFGGICLPKDLAALQRFATDLGASAHLLTATAAANHERPERIVALLCEHLGDVAGRTIAVLGLAFKPGTDDLRDSPALGLVRALQARGSQVRGYDPMVADDAHPLLPDALMVCTTPEQVLRGADAALLATAWPEFAAWDWERLGRLMARPLVLDGRNALRNIALPQWLVYQPIGRTPKS